MPHTSDSNIPLAERMRPVSLDNFFGQDHLVGEGKILRQLLSGGTLPSLLFWGPPGSGKTTLATILARSVSARFIFFSAVLSGVKDIRRIVEEARDRLEEHSAITILFVDEIHRFNKGQQDAFLPHVESGLLTLIGATTENPSFQIIAPLLSRCQVLPLKPLNNDSIHSVLVRALADEENGLGSVNVLVDDEALALLAGLGDGDCRRALNYLETAFSLAVSLAKKNKDTQQARITTTLVEEAIQHRTLRYDAGGEEHYNLISALHKSMRDSDPDGAIYWLSRMLVSGEDPLYIARRMIRFASEDIGNADPQALQVAMNCRDAFQMLGSPEGELALVQAAAYLATAPKSNALYLAEKQVRKDIKATGSLPVPLHIRNAPTKLMKDMGYGKGYRYAHDSQEAVVDQEHLPTELAGKTYYHPTNRGFEAIIRDRLTKWREILRQRTKHHGKKRTKY